MRRSKCEHYFHAVWATAARRQLITKDIQANVYRCIGSEVVKLGGTVLGLGGMPDHVHLLVQLPGKVSMSDLMQKAKGVSSTLIRKELAPSIAFNWQDNYASFTVSRSHVPRVIKYINNQERHHSKGTVWEEWEETDEESPIADDLPTSVPDR
jgi:REP element-mobilizing transposase RayT